MQVLFTPVYGSQNPLIFDHISYALGGQQLGSTSIGETLECIVRFNFDFNASSLTCSCLSSLDFTSLPFVTAKTIMSTFRMMSQTVDKMQLNTIDVSRFIYPEDNSNDALTAMQGKNDIQVNIVALNGIVFGWIRRR